MNGLIPVALYIPLKRFKYDWEYNATILGYQAYNVVIVPQEQGTLSNLTMEKQLSSKTVRDEQELLT